MKHQKQNRISRTGHATICSGLLAGCLLFGSGAHAGITFQFNYLDDPGTGFLDPLYGASRQAALNTAASTFSTMFGSHFSNSGTIVLAAKDISDASSLTLASAASFVADPGVPGFNLKEIVRTKLLTGEDANGAAVDGVVNVNFAQRWDLDFNNPPAWYSGQYDFYGTLYHEFTHALGFNPYITESGAPRFGTKDAGSWSSFASFITDKNDVSIINHDTFALNQDAWDAGSIGNWGGGKSEGLFFNGENAVAANDGYLVTLYTSGEWEPGSSVGHLDDRMSGFEGTMMAPGTGPGLQVHDYSAVEVGILTDLGYTVSAVPEPETYSMLLAGLAMFGWIMRRRIA